MLPRANRVIGVLAVAVAALRTCAACSAQDSTRSPPVAVRCAVVGGLNEIDFWPQIADRFQRATGCKLEIAATGPKHAIAEVFQSGEADVIAMHASDTMVNLVADGYGENLQPWAKNDFVLVGPASDPATIKGETDAVLALGKIIKANSKLLLHASSGANELLSDLLAAGELELDPAATISLQGERQRQILQRAAAEQAYAIVGRIPFLSGKLETGDLVIMVQGDVRLRRTYLVAVATKLEADRQKVARRFAAFLREPATQEFIGSFGRGRFDERPLLFSVTVSR